MVAFHQEPDADVTVAARPVPRPRPRSSAMLAVDATGRVVDFVEKPTHAAAHAGRPRAARSCRWGTTSSPAARSSTRCWPTPGSYTDHDFGTSDHPGAGAHRPRLRLRLPDQRGARASSRTRSRATGATSGTLEAYWRAHMDLLGETPALRPRQPALADPRRASYAARRPDSSAATSRTPRSGKASLVKRATIRNSILGRSRVGQRGRGDRGLDRHGPHHGRQGGPPPARHRRSLQHHPGRTARWASTPPPTGDRYCVDPSGLVVVPRGGRREFLWNTEPP